MKLKIVLMLFAIWGMQLLATPNKINIIPLPNKVEIKDGELKLPSLLSIDNAFEPKVSELLISIFHAELKIEAHLSSKNNLVRYELNKKLDDEEYILSVDSTGILISSSSSAGSMLAVQSLRQLLVQAKLSYQGQTKRIPALCISDKPRYGWRSFHMDVARQMFSVEYIKKTIERIAYYKINKLHLHLSDDQGWRIEIDKYPLLTEVGAWRELNHYDYRIIQDAAYNTEMQLDKQFLKNDSIYGGYYTKGELREIINHADKYGVDIIPEIDMPGHMSAAIKAYPWLSCIAKTAWGEEFSHPICPSNPKVLDFAKDIYDELIDLFPGKYIHIGADEVERHTSWDLCKVCKNKMKKEKMKSSEELQTSFVNEIAAHIKAKNKTVLAWDDIALGDVDRDIYIMHWRDWMNENPKKIIDNKHSMIFTTWSHFYLSAWPNFNLWKGIYQFDISKGYPGMTEDLILGYQACVWTEHIPTEAKFEEHVYPSIQAFSELVWTRNEIRNWDDFLSRLSIHKRYMDTQNIRYHIY